MPATTARRRNDFDPYTVARDIPTQEADDAFRCSQWFEQLDDYHFDPTQLGHTYLLEDGRVVLMIRKGDRIVPTRFRPSQLD
jgi:hypothetical protein